MTLELTLKTGVFLPINLRRIALRGIRRGTESHNVPLILGLHFLYIFSGIGTIRPELTRRWVGVVPDVETLDAHTHRLPCCYELKDKALNAANAAGAAAPAAAAAAAARPPAYDFQAIMIASASLARYSTVHVQRIV